MSFEAFIRGFTPTGRLKNQALAQADTWLKLESQRKIVEDLSDYPEIQFLVTGILETGTPSWLLTYITGIHKEEREGALLAAEKARIILGKGGALTLPHGTNGQDHSVDYSEDLSSIPSVNSPQAIFLQGNTMVFKPYLEESLIHDGQGVRFGNAPEDFLFLFAEGLGFYVGNMPIAMGLLTDIGVWNKIQSEKESHLE